MTDLDDLDFDGSDPTPFCFRCGEQYAPCGDDALCEDCEDETA